MRSRLLALAVCAMLAAACGNSTTSPTSVPPTTASQAAGAPTPVEILVTPVPAASPSASPVELTKKELGALYVATATKYNKVLDKADTKLPTYPTLKQWRAYCQTMATAERHFEDEVGVIAWTADYKADVRDLLKADAKYQLLFLDCARAKSTADLNRILPKLYAASDAAAAAANFLRHQLGLKSVPG